MTRPQLTLVCCDRTGHLLQCGQRGVHFDGTRQTGGAAVVDLVVVKAGLKSTHPHAQVESDRNGGNMAERQTGVCEESEWGLTRFL